MDNLENEYYKNLEQFRERAINLINNGGAYLVVIASHELYRFLYPYEPYEDIFLKDPLPFIVEKIKKLNNWLTISQYEICFYHYSPKELNEEKTLEKNTSDLYTSLWNKFEDNTILKESRELVEKRIPKEIIESKIKDKVVLDMGCGSGRYSIALSLLGAKKVYGIDLFSQSYQISKKIVEKKNLNIEFIEGNFHSLPFENESFDFVFSNGTIHHSTSIEKSLDEYKRVLKNQGNGFLYIYADKGIFWNTRKVLREVFKDIPSWFSDSVLSNMGLPKNRFIFSDVWHVPIETHTTKEAIEEMLRQKQFRFQKLISQNRFDLDYALSLDIPNKEIMWGDGEHRYLLEKHD